jgi:hypothetical protein
MSCGGEAHGHDGVGAQARRFFAHAIQALFARFGESFVYGRISPPVRFFMNAARSCPM